MRRTPGTLAHVEPCVWEEARRRAAHFRRQLDPIAASPEEAVGSVLDVYKRQALSTVGGADGVEHIKPVANSVLLATPPGRCVRRPQRDSATVIR